MRFKANRQSIGRIIKCLSLMVLLIGVNVGALGQQRVEAVHAQVEQLITQGDRQLKSGENQGALDSYNRALSLCSVHYPRAYACKGDALYNLSRYGEALDAYQTALDRGFNNPPIYLMMGLSHFQLGNIDLAINNMLQYTSKRPSDSAGYIALAWYYSFKREYRLSVDAGLKAVRYAPQNYMGYTNLCRAYNDMGRYSDAVDSCKEALKLKPGDGESNLYLGYAYSFLDQEEAADAAIGMAIVGLEKFTRDNPKEADAYYLLGNAYMAADKSASAIGPLKTATILRPNFPFAVASLGFAYWQTGDKSRAEEQYRILRRLDEVEAEKLWKRISSSSTSK